MQEWRPWTRPAPWPWSGAMNGPRAARSTPTSWRRGRDRCGGPADRGRLSAPRAGRAPAPNGSSRSAPGSGLMVVDRASSEDAGMAAALASARFIYSRAAHPPPAGGAQEVGRLRRTAGGLRRRRRRGRGRCGGHGVTDPMADPRGGALTLGLGLVGNLTVVPHFGDRTTTPTDRSSSGRWPCAGGAPGRRPAGPDRAHPGRIGYLARRGGRDAGRIRRRPLDRGAGTCFKS